MVNQTILPEKTFSGHQYAGKLDSWLSEAGMVQVELIAAFILEKERVL